MKSEHAILPGDKFGSWEVIGPSSDKPYHFTCKCVCGSVKDVYRSALISGASTSCGCSRFGKENEKTQKLNLTKAEDKIGTIVNGFKITGVEKREYFGHNQFFCRAICPVCGKETSALMTNLRHMKMCVSCNRGTDKFLADMRSEVCISGSSLSSVKSRVEGKVNKNSTTKVNGISFRNGKYRAYINFKRKQYHLGVFNTLNEAVEARKAAEKEIYGEYLDQNSGWEERVSEIALKYKNTKCSKKESQNGNT